MKKTHPRSICNSGWIELFKPVFMTGVFFLAVCFQTIANNGLQANELALGPDITSGEYSGALTTTELQQLELSGRVLDRSGESLPGVSVIVAGTTIGTVTDINGNFTLSVPADAQRLVFSFVGLRPTEVVIGDQRVFNITMDEEVIDISELVVVGYATQRRVNLTGSVTIVRAEELAEISVPLISQALMGRSPGVFIKNKQGQPGEEGVDINIRGFGTPLIIVDGTPVTRSYFQQLEASDIESFNVLKDASAAAVYGARAGNGVIIVETKRGTESAPQFSYSGNYTQQFFPFKLDQVGSAEYAAMYNVAQELWKGQPARWTAEEIQKFRDGSDPVNYPNTDWWSETLRDYAPQHQHGLNVRGGTERIKYYTGVNYFNQRGMHRSDDTDYSRFTIRSNVDIQLTDKLTAGVDLSATNQDFIGPANKLERGRGSEGFGGIMGRIWRSRPFAPNTPLPDPTKVPAMLSGLTINPYYQGVMEHSGFNEWNRLYGFGKLKFEYELPFGFKARASFDMNRTFYRDRLRKLEMPQYDYDAATDTYTLRRKDISYNFLREEQSIDKNLNQQYFLTWDRTLGDHEFNALAVYEILSDDYDYFRAFRRDYEFPIDYLFAGPDENKDNTGFQRQGGRKAWIGRVNYNYKGKYLFEVSGRADGSPKFPADTRWGYFPSASVGWRISEEPFMSDNLPIIWNLKLRASHGMLGYDAAGAFQYLSTFSIRSAYMFEDARLSGIRADALPNDRITWEKMTITNVGADFNIGGFLEGTIDYFYRLRTDVLGARLRDIPDVVGANLPQENFREFDNRGWELSLYHMNNVGDFRYNIGGNISTNREKTVYTDQPEYTTRENWRTSNSIGEWTDRFWAYPTDGLFKSWDEIHSIDYDIDGQGNRTIRPGDIKYIDYNGDGRISGEDRIIAGRGTTPRLIYGLDLSFGWKNFDFSMLWQGAGMFNYNLRGGGRDFIMPFYAENGPTMFMYENMYVEENQWMPANTSDPLWPRFGDDSVNRSHRNFNLNNEFWLTSGAYIKLRNIQLGYTIPRQITQQWNINSLKVFVSGYGVLTITPTPYKFIDPEIDTSPARAFGDYHPTVATWNFGVQMNF